MAEKTKVQLGLDNQSQFPNNNTGFITPDKLRTFHQDMIDSLVDELTYDNDIQNINDSIDSINTNVSGNTQDIQQIQNDLDGLTQDFGILVGEVQDLDLTKMELNGSNSNVDKLHFNPTTTEPLVNVGDIRFNSSEDTLEVKLSNDVTLQIGEENLVRAKNDTGSIVANGTVVYIYGASGANPLFRIATTDDLNIAERTIGVVTESVGVGEYGFITIQGIVNDINTNGLTEGGLIYLNGTGLMTSTEPVAPNAKVIIGICLRANNVNGKIIVAVDVVKRLTKLSDVFVSGLTQNDTIVWNGTTNRWEKYNLNNKLSTTGGTVTGVVTFNVSPTVPTPTGATDAANRQFVLDNASSAGAGLNVTHPEVAFYGRVSGDTGTVNLELSNSMFQEFLNRTDTIVLDVEVASKIRVSGTTQYINKIYNLPGSTYDAVQATASSQPYLGNFIAPNEKKSQKFVKNQTNNGLLPYTTKSFVSGDSFTMIMTFKPNAYSTVINVGNGYLYFSTGGISLTVTPTTVFQITTPAIIGKVNILEFRYNGGIGTVKLNGSIVGSTILPAACTFNKISTDISVNTFDGNVYYFSVTPSYISENESQLVNTYLRNQYTEIEGIGIGNQYWATSNYEGISDNLGNVINEVQGATTTGNTEQLVNGDYEAGLLGTFDNSAGGATAAYSQNTISPISGTKDGLMVVTNAGTDGLFPRIVLNSVSPSVTGKIYKLTFQYKMNSGTCNVIPRFGAANFTTLTATGTTSGTYTGYIAATTNSTAGYFQFDGRNLFSIQIDNVSLKEVGWDESTIVYNYFIAKGDTVSVATNKAAMWCHYNNSTDSGSVYGKIYNWYAVSMISNNPPKSWRIPTKVDFDQLVAYVGGSTNGGTKLKYTGSTYMQQTVPSTNETGLSVIGSGSRNAAGVFANIGGISLIWSSTSNDATTAYNLPLYGNDASSTVAAGDKIVGRSIRLIRNAPVGLDAIEVTTGNFITNIASGVANKDMIIPFGYTPKEVKVISTNNLTSFSCNLLNTSGVLQNNLLSNKVATAGVNVSYIVLADQNVQYTDPILRFNCVGNTTGGMEIKVLLIKNMF